MTWFPSVFQEPTNPQANTGGDTAGGNKKGKGKEKIDETTGPPTAPVLAFSWGNALRVIKIEEVKVKQVLKNAKTGKEREVEVGAIVYKDMLSWTAEEEILAIQWLNAQVSRILAFCC